MRKGGQVWVETVIYTLIGLGLIGLVLSVAIPRLDERKDTVAVDQALDSLSRINAKVGEVQTVPGNRRFISLLVGKGDFSVDASSDTFSWSLPSSAAYSEPGVTLTILGVNVTTSGSSGDYIVLLERDYSGVFNVTVGGSDTASLDFSPSSVDYSFFVENDGRDVSGLTVINVGGS